MVPVSIDLVYGPVANDRVYAAFALYESELLDKEGLIKELKTYKLVDQMLFHTDKSGQLPKTEPLRLRYSSLQRLGHWQLVTGGSSENENKQAIPMMQAKACTDGASYILEYPS